MVLFKRNVPTPPKRKPLCYRIPRPRSHTARYRIVQGRTDMRFRATQLGRRLQRGHTLQRRCMAQPGGLQTPLWGRFLWSWVPMQRHAFAWGRRSSETTETSGLPGGEGCAACDDAKRPRPRKKFALLPYPTTTQPHGRVPYPTGQNGIATAKVKLGCAALAKSSS